MTAKLLTEFKQKISGLELVPGDGGCFEIDADGERIYSKLDAGAFPDEDAIVGIVGKMV